MKPAMKLYIWNNPYSVIYGGSVLYAVAESEERAREMALTAGISKYGHAPEGTAGELRKLGAPDRIMDLPYAEIYEWSE